MTPDDFLKQYKAALSSQKWQSVEPLMHKNVSVTFTNGTFQGIEKVKAVFENNFEQIADEKYAISNVHWAHVSATEAVLLLQVRLFEVFCWQMIGKCLVSRIIRSA